MNFKQAAEEELTCSDCKHCQINKKLPNVYIGYLCMNEDSKQNGYYGATSMETDENYLCNRFEEYVEEE